MFNQNVYFLMYNNRERNTINYILSHNSFAGSWSTELDPGQVEFLVALEFHERPIYLRLVAMVARSLSSSRPPRPP